ncbi:ECF transporter S component [Lacticaseibacillus chiayiensis]|uniref:ECF transporter S component n=1 Tax=Lacticaseibacillus chiayiensis TaxID=2100821 RepID=A0A4Q1TLU2_9LACO|nr:ECF transporter S component [Lacticaseibacillus chiayiensis]QVI34136.1 ECF transporter S component [Lacticaseibacillus chiayiensis]RXT19454.1 ECF transporter S component [Lacticaseibacillus chiayiensis]UYN55915.1 ECF transporter S component [Lacticaseibacillus chiayiensis]
MKLPASTKKPSPVRAVALLGLLTALCTVLRIVKVPIPNVQPVTDILMVVTLLLGMRWGLSLTVSTLVVSNLVLGFGLWTLPQIAAYMVCLLVLQMVVLVLPMVRRVLWLQMGLAGLLGYLYGFVVSLGMAIIGSLNGLGFWAYYISGLLFDTYHALGNLVFYPIVLLVLQQGLQRFNHG